MQEPASTTQPSVTGSQSEIASRAEQLREQATSAPLEARDAAWGWFQQLGEEVGRDRDQGSAALAELFALGTPPAGIDGRTEGILVAPLITGSVDRAMRGLAGAWMPWMGKRFDAERKRGDNVLRQSARWPVKLFWPLYATRDLGDDRTAFDFETRVEPSEDDSSVDVLVIDYVVMDSNPRFLIKRIRDELVEIVPGANLGKVLWRHGDGSYALIGYFALRNDPASDRT
ncbi:MAG TPA: hypothetical protein VIL53_00685 [Solirubrobacterales bacterium]